ncbi:uncharacterized protein Dana_GF12111 [Drosophila ananassae]|uniref:Uncharacterized protein n=2 Tax=Drosophila ananassae TaxID=7217 RepID=B3MBV9_DROAN|nr:uncharacterized protein LOC6494969 isoform X1 [Drosophila ananassae]EDV36130.1 uncharacterized protein Dana_GF12111 [Drosophila ananassae]
MTGKVDLLAELPQLLHIMASHSIISRSTVTESMAKFALNKLAVSDAHEKTVIRLLLSIEEKFREYFDTYKKEVELQRIAAETLSHLIQRYMIATQVDTSCTRPQIYEIETEDAIVNKYHMHYQVIDGSNKSQKWAVQALRPFVLAFRRECAKINMDEDTPFVMGDAFHKPIKFFIDLVDEIFDYFYSAYLQLDCGARLLDPMDIKSMEQYKILLAPNEDFEEYFMHNMSFCKCLRIPPKCIEKKVDDCQPKKDVRDHYMNVAKKSRCARRVAKMAGQLPESTPVVAKPVESMVFSSVVSDMRLRNDIVGNSKTSLPNAGESAFRQIHERYVSDQLRRALSLSNYRLIAD